MAQRGDRLVLNTLYLVVGVMQIVVALWLYRLLPGMAVVLMIVGGLLCILAGMGKR
jgi:predicted membrane channel-forming protein YqfA (hemolysin III family)